MADIDPATAYRTLTARAAALRAEAEAARKQSVGSDAEDDRRLGLRRDELTASAGRWRATPRSPTPRRPSSTSSAR